MKKILLLLLLLSAMSITLAIMASQEPSPLIRPIPGPDDSESVLAANEKITEESPYNTEELKNVVQTALSGTKGSYAVAVKHLPSGVTYYQNENEIYETASLYKLWIMATAFKQIEDGVLEKDAIVQSDVAELNKRFNIASESAELQEGAVSMNVDTALERMITISHNYAALLLTIRVKLTNVTAFLKKYGFTSSKVGQPPQTTAKDIALFFEKLYLEELANKESTNEMFSLLLQQKLNNKLPKYLPANVPFAHKTGELGSFTHDAGIVYGKNGKYIIVVLSKSTSPLGAEERIATLSKAVYEYFETQ